MNEATPVGRRDARLRSLLLPLEEPRAVGCATLLLFIYYAWSAARDLSLYDSGELALAAVQLGLGHPPGQPLHTLFGFLLSRLPLVGKLFGVTLASVLPAALTLVPATSLAQTLLGPSASRGSLRALPFLLALVALHPVLWEPATRVEVYALATFFAVWAVARLASAGGEPLAPTARDVLAAAVALGLAASANPMIALATGLALAPMLLLQVARRRLSPHALALALLGGALGLLPYLYVFAVASRTDVMVWGAPRDAASALHYFTLADYKANHALTLPLWTSHFVSWFAWAAEQWLWPLLAVGVAGHVVLAQRTALGRSVGPLLLVLLVAQISFNVVWNLEVPDYAGYVASALWVLAAGALAYAAHAYEQKHLPAALLLTGCVVLASLVASPHLLARTRHRDSFARTLAEQALREAPKNAIVIAELDHVVGALFYLQEIERARPDVVVIAHGLASSSWHWERVYRRHPELLPIALVGPGGRAGRLRRFVLAQPMRPVLVERLGMAAELGLGACYGGLFLRTGIACAEPKAPSPALPSMLAATLLTLGDGSPGARGAVAQTAFALGETWWRLGFPRAAYGALLAGVPHDMQPLDAQSAPAELDALSPLDRRLPAFRKGAALGDPAQNLYLAAMLCEAAGQRERSRELLSAAAEAGLPEAVELLQPPME